MAVGLGAAILFAYSYKRLERGGMSAVVRYVVFGVAVLSLVHLFEDAAIFIEALEPYELWAEHLLGIAGFLLLGRGAWELYNVSESGEK